MEPRPDTLSRKNATPPASEYILHPDGVHEIIYNEVSHAAVDQYMVHFDHILRSTPPEGTVYIVSNGSRVKEMQPISYLMGRFRDLMKRHAQRPAVHIVILYDQTIIADLMNGLFRVFVRGRDRMRFFKVAEREEAIQWLFNG